MTTGKLYVHNQNRGRNWVEFTRTEQKWEGYIVYSSAYFNLSIHIWHSKKKAGVYLFWKNLLNMEKNIFCGQNHVRGNNEF